MMLVNCIQLKSFSHGRWHFSAGVEKTLRLAQSVAQVVAGLSYLPEEAAPWLKARSQFALGELCNESWHDLYWIALSARRYLRLTKWIDCWQVMHTQFYAQSHSSIRTTLAVAKWSFLGIYFFLEMLTIVSTNVKRRANSALVDAFLILPIRLMQCN